MNLERVSPNEQRIFEEPRPFPGSGMQAANENEMVDMEVNMRLFVNVFNAISGAKLEEFSVIVWKLWCSQNLARSNVVSANNQTDSSSHSVDLWSCYVDGAIQ
ncbi:hypothetical protein ACFE04_020971 [Oxalis oulophora]